MDFVSYSEFPEYVLLSEPLSLTGLVHSLPVLSLWSIECAADTGMASIFPDGMINIALDNEDKYLSCSLGKRLLHYVLKVDGYGNLVCHLLLLVHTSCPDVKHTLVDSFFFHI